MLDEPSVLKRVDRGNMLSRIESLPEQLIESKALVADLKGVARPKSILVLGMGGSGIVGDLLNGWLRDRIEIPVVTNRDTSIPCVNEETMIVAVSYSGNTMETLTALDRALERTANIICIASGGALVELCEGKGLNLVRVPSGYPPRCAIGYLFGSAVHTLKKMQVHDGEDELNEAASHLRWLRDMLRPDRETSTNPAKRLALELGDSIPIIYAYEGLHSCAKRWQTQLNENSKVLSWCGTLPEMAHNQIVGLTGDERANELALVLLRDEDEPELVKDRFEALKGRVKCKVLEVWSEGRSKLARMFHLIHMGDFVSYYLAILRGVDPLPVKVIEELKREGLE